MHEQVVGTAQADSAMAMKTFVYHWLQQVEYESWLCAHALTLIDELSKSGNVVVAVGLENVKAPEAVVLMSRALDSAIVEEVCRNQPSLRAIHDGANALVCIVCQEHFVSVQCATVDLGV